MKEYLIIWECNNGYTCRCCQQTWEFSEIMEFESEEEFQEWFDSQNKEFEPDERKLSEAYELAEGGFRHEG